MPNVLIDDSTMEEIGNAIREKTGGTGKLYPREMAAAIRGIDGATVEESFGALPDPQKVYDNTRPGDWLTMPEPSDDEIYMLFHIGEESSKLLAFTVTCTSENYNVALGTVTDGAFTPVSSQDVQSGITYETEFSASDWESETSDGAKQVMIKVSGSGITGFTNSVHSQGDTTKDWNLVDILAQLPNVTRFVVGSGLASAPDGMALSTLRYFRLVGTNALGTCQGMFAGCTELKSIRIDKLNISTCSGMYLKCSTLVAAPNVELNVSGVSLASLYSGCEKLKAVPDIIGAKITTITGIFNGCKALQIAPEIMSAPITNAVNAFLNCASLVYIPPFSMELSVIPTNLCNGCASLRSFPMISVKSTLSSALFTSAFSGCISLQSVLMNHMIEGWAGSPLPLSKCNLGHAALVQLFKSLPTITAEKTITLTGNPGVDNLTEEEKSIATEKGWKLTL